jgi:lycopene cyclase domain-containing protein
MPAYAALTILAICVSVVLDLALLRTKLVFRATFWLSLAIMLFFQVFVDGWLTRKQGTIVIYDQARFSGLRLFFHTPVEDFGFGFALILCTLAVWTRLGRGTEWL